MRKLEIVSTKRAPAAIGPYSQAIAFGDLVYTAGQIPLDPETMEITPGGIKEQTERVLQNLVAVLEEAGAGLESVIKTTVYLSDMAHFAEMNEVYADFFRDHRPARTAIEVARLPLDVDVEIEAVAAKLS